MTGCKESVKGTKDIARGLMDVDSRRVLAPPTALVDVGGGRRVKLSASGSAGEEGSSVEKEF